MVCGSDHRCVEGCYLGETVYALGDKNPSNACESCSAASAAEWTVAGKGTKCGNGMVCDDSQQCIEGCSIGGQLYAHGAPNPSNSCVTCHPSNEASWTATANPGASCGDGKVCDGTHQCVDGCYISGKLYSIGEFHPSNACQYCDATNTAGWTKASKGTPCGSGMVCNDNSQCSNGCFIDGGLFAHGVANPSNSCETCNPLDPTKWTGTGAVGSSCGSGKVCNASYQCVEGCFIGGKLYSAGAVNPLVACEICHSSNTTGWTKSAVGTECESGKICNASAQCVRRTLIAAGGAHTCATTPAGGVRCWGNNEFGQLGADLWVSESPLPVDVSGLTSDVVALSAGTDHTCAIRQGGELLCWGYNDGALGDGSYEARRVPTAVVGMSSNARAVSAGGYNTCAITFSDAAMCWGLDTTPSLVPTQVVGLTSAVVAISAGGAHTCSILAGGAAACWGQNGCGQLGLGVSSPSEVLVPTLLSELESDVTAISARDVHSCALSSNGTVKCWGQNQYGQCGTGSSGLNLMSPATVMGLQTDIIAITLGFFHTCALSSAGAVKCWGRNNMGQLGDGTTVNRVIPTAVVGLSSGVLAIAAGNEHTCAVVQPGSVVCWGAGEWGQLGDGTAMNSTKPVPVVGFP